MWTMHTLGAFPGCPPSTKLTAKFHSGFYPNSDSFDKITYWLVLFYHVSFLVSWFTITYNSAQNELTDATARAYSNQATKCNHTLRDKAVTLTLGLFLHRRHHQDYIWSERSTALHSYLLHLEEKRNMCNCFPAVKQRWKQRHAYNY